jgi:TatD-related deoxyribonuclease
LVRMRESLGLEEAKAQIVRGAEEAAKFVEEGLAVGIGEVGRLHFEVEPEVQEAANESLQEVLRIAKEVDAAVQLHTESADPEVMRDLATRAERAGLGLDRVVKHYSAPLVRDEENHGLFPSVIASRRHVREALEGSPQGRFFLETDYIDDRSRRNAVLPIETVPKRITGFLQSGEITTEQAYKIAVEHVERVYRVETGF